MVFTQTIGNFASRYEVYSVLTTLATINLNIQKEITNLIKKMTEAERKHPCPTNGKWWILSPECRHCFHYEEDLDREHAYCMLGYHERKRINQ